MKKRFASNASNNKLEELPHELGRYVDRLRTCRLSKLKILDINTNSIAILPPDVADLDNIEKIDISCNPLIKQIDEAARYSSFLYWVEKVILNCWNISDPTITMLCIISECYHSHL